jgi:uncharacterized membrane-anchored protein
MDKRTRARVALVAAIQLGLVAVAVAPRLSAYATGEEHLLQVAGLDPIDPFRGAYTQLDYPDLPLETRRPVEGDVFLLLEQLPDGTWGSTAMVTDRPDAGPYLACEGGWRLSCGIESWFTSDNEARRLEQALAAGTGIATVRIDSRGHAVLVDIDAG